MPAIAVSTVDGARIGGPAGPAESLHPLEHDTDSDGGVSLPSGDEAAGCLPRALSRAALPFCMVAQADTHYTAYADQPTFSSHPAGVTNTGRTAAERRAIHVLAQREHDGRPFTHADLWSVLSLWKCRRSAGQGKLPYRGATFAPSDTFGLVRNAQAEGPSPEAWQLTHRAQEFPNFCTLVNSFLLQQLTAEQRRRFRFSTFTINHEVTDARRRDRCIAGLSAAYAAGPFRGGALRYWDGDPSSSHGSDTADAVDLRVRQKVWLFDGTRAHEVAPFEGQRASVVWYPVEDVWDAGRGPTEAATRLKFAPPCTAEECRVSVADLMPCRGPSVASSKPVKTAVPKDTDAADSIAGFAVVAKIPEPGHTDDLASTAGTASAVVCCVAPEAIVHENPGTDKPQTKALHNGFSGGYQKREPNQQLPER